MNAKVFFLKDVMRIKVRKTTKIVETAAHEVGKNINPVISNKTIDAGIFFKNSLIIEFFCNPIKSREPDAISQKREGIKKYAAGWLFWYRYKKAISDAKAKVPTDRNRLREPFLVCLANPENQIRNGKMR